MCQGQFRRVRRPPSIGRILPLLSTYPRSSRCPCGEKRGVFPNRTSHASWRLQGLEKDPYQACQRRSGRPQNWLIGGGRLVLGCSPPFPTVRCNIGGECYLSRKNIQMRRSAQMRRNPTGQIRRSAPMCRSPTGRTRRSVPTYHILTDQMCLRT